MTFPPPNRWAWPLLLVLWSPLPAGLTLFRLAFLGLYRDRFAGLPVSDVVAALVTGWRYDLSISMAVAGVPLVAVLAVSRWDFRRWVLWAAFAWILVVTLALLVLAGGDLFYYEFAGRHVSFEARTLLIDWRPIAGMAAGGYLLPAVGILALLGAGATLWFTAVKRLAARPNPPQPRWSVALQTVLLALVVGVGWRGAIGAKPLSVGHAFRGGAPVLGQLALNAPFTVRVALFGRGQQVLHVLHDDEAIRVARKMLGFAGPPVDPDYPLWHRTESPLPHRRKNVVIIAIESFSAQMTGVLGGKTGVTDNFDALAREGLLFSRFHSNGTRSVEGIAAILGGYPAIPKAPVIGSSLEQTNQDNLARVLGAEGYSRVFVHGAFRGSMWLDVYARRAGFRRYVAQEDFQDYRSKSDGTWGVYDEYTAERLHEEIEAAPKPVLAFLFTLNPHTPFELPPGRAGKFPADAPGAGMMNAFAYADAALGQFFRLARESGYWRDTIFVVTADHNMGKGKLNRRESMWIPLLILDPGNPDFPAGRVTDLLGSQADIAPTILDLIGLEAGTAMAGRSLLGPGGSRFALHAWADQAGWQEDGWLIVHNLRKPTAVYDLRVDVDLRDNLLRRGRVPPAATSALRDFKAYLETTNNLLLRNRLLPPGAPRGSR